MRVLQFGLGCKNTSFTICLQAFRVSVLWFKGSGFQAFGFQGVGFKAQSSCAQQPILCLSAYDNSYFNLLDSQTAKSNVLELPFFPNEFLILPRRYPLVSHFFPRFPQLDLPPIGRHFSITIQLQGHVQRRQSGGGFQGQVHINGIEAHVLIGSVSWGHYLNFMDVSTYIYIYVYIYICNQRQRQRQVWICAGSLGRNLDGAFLTK